MDINDLRALSTLLVFLAFCSLLLWTLTPTARKTSVEAAKLPFADNDDEVKHD